MTQMLLFDSPAATENFSASPIPVADCPAADCPGKEAPVVQRSTKSLENDADRGGMHHMGDLARLVLMRYELVAQRRAALAAKQAR